VLVGISSDITEQARMTQETKERGQQLEAIFDTAPFAIFIADRSGHIRWCNDNACELFGMHSRDLTNASLKQLMDPSSYQQFKDDLNHALKVNELLNVDVSIKSESKGIVPINMMGSSVMHIGEESVIYFAVDQTDRIAKENELIKSRDLLKQQSEQFKRYLDSAPIPVTIVEGDKNGRRFTYVNDETLRVLGYSREEMLGENATEMMFVCDEDRQRYLDAVVASMQPDAAPLHIEMPLYRKNKVVGQFLMTGRYYMTPHGALQGTLFVFDIEERKRYEKALIAAKEEAATVHQLPLADTLKGSALVVDDIESNRMALSRLLNIMGMQTAAVANASAAVTALAKQPFDVVVTDLHMPNASGLELLEMIRRGIHPNVNKETPLVFLTADVVSSDKQAAEALGISGWLHKPMNRKEISQVLNAVLQGKETNELTQVIPTEDTKDKASLKAWNRAEMTERMVDNDVLLNNICSLFLGNLPQLQSSIQVAYSSRDAEEGALQAHTLKGAAANASAEKLHAVAKALENAFRAANWERVERYVKELPEAIRVTEEAMLAYQERSQS